MHPLLQPLASQLDDVALTPTFGSFTPFESRWTKGADGRMATDVVVIAQNGTVLVADDASIGELRAACRVLGAELARLRRCCGLELGAASIDVESCH
jgi:hypothetical protein